MQSMLAKTDLSTLPMSSGVVCMHDEFALSENQICPERKSWFYTVGFDLMEQSYFS